MNLSEHFTLEELVFSSTAARLGINNSANGDIITALTIAAIGMEQVRSLLGNNPIHVDSGYRCPALNKAVGGASNSAHMQGYAVDFFCAEFGTPIDIITAIMASAIAFDQLIQEGTWVHISFAPTMRHQVLTAHFNATGTTYTAGNTST